MISSYYNDDDEIFLERVINDESQSDGRLSYEEPVLLHCFIVKGLTQVVNRNNQIITSTASYATETEIRVNDKIDGRIVVAVDRPKGGDLTYWRAYV